MSMWVSSVFSGSHSKKEINKLVDRWIGDAKLPLGVNVCERLSVWCPEMDSHPIQVVFPGKAPIITPVEKASIYLRKKAI